MTKTDLIMPEAREGDCLQLCRLCAGPTTLAFDARLLAKYSVSYWRCQRCGSLQTDPPYWLEEAYRNTDPVHDTGMVARTLQMAMMTSFLLRIAGINTQTPALDWGGGNGLFCRMMRDQGFAFRNYDKYVAPFYSVGFSADRARLGRCAVVTSFEVFEHLPAPAADLAEIIALDPLLWIFSTQLYRDQGQDWNYLSLASGHHVFFYSARGLHDFAASHGFHFMPGRHVHMLARRAGNPYLSGPGKRRLLQRILAGGKLVTMAAALNFHARQRHAYLRWQDDREALRSSPRS